MTVNIETSNDIPEHSSVHVSNYEEATCRDEPPGEILKLFNELIIIGKSKLNILAEIKFKVANYLFSTGCDISEGGDFHARVENFAKCYLKCISLEESASSSFRIPSNPSITYHNNWEFYSYYEEVKKANHLVRIRRSIEGNLRNSIKHYLPLVKISDNSEPDPAEEINAKLIYKRMNDLKCYFIRDIRNIISGERPAYLY